MGGACKTGAATRPACAAALVLFLALWALIDPLEVLIAIPLSALILRLERLGSAEKAMSEPLVQQR